MKRLKQWIAFLLAAAMLTSVLPAGALALDVSGITTGLETVVFKMDSSGTVTQFDIQFKNGYADLAITAALVPSFTVDGTYNCFEYLKQADYSGIKSSAVSGTGGTSDFAGGLLPARSWCNAGNATTSYSLDTLKSGRAGNTLPFTKNQVAECVSGSTVTDNDNDLGGYNYNLVIIQGDGVVNIIPVVLTENGINTEGEEPPTPEQKNPAELQFVGTSRGTTAVSTTLAENVSSAHSITLYVHNKAENSYDATVTRIELDSRLTAAGVTKSDIINDTYPSGKDNSVVRLNLAATTTRTDYYGTVTIYWKNGVPGDETEYPMPIFITGYNGNIGALVANPSPIDFGTVDASYSAQNGTTTLTVATANANAWASIYDYKITGITGASVSGITKQSKHAYISSSEYYGKVSENDALRGSTTGTGANKMNLEVTIPPGLPAGFHWGTITINYEAIQATSAFVARYQPVETVLEIPVFINVTGGSGEVPPSLSGTPVYDIYTGASSDRAPTFSYSSGDWDGGINGVAISSSALASPVRLDPGDYKVDETNKTITILSTAKLDAAASGLKAGDKITATVTFTGTDKEPTPASIDITLKDSTPASFTATIVVQKDGGNVADVSGIVTTTAPIKLVDKNGTEHAVGNYDGTNSRYTVSGLLSENGPYKVFVGSSQYGTVTVEDADNKRSATVDYYTVKATEGTGAEVNSAKYMNIDSKVVLKGTQVAADNLTASPDTNSGYSGSASWTVSGNAVTFPYTVNAATTFVANFSMGNYEPQITFQMASGATVAIGDAGIANVELYATNNGTGTDKLTLTATDTAGIYNASAGNDKSYGSVKFDTLSKTGYVVPVTISRTSTGATITLYTVGTAVAPTGGGTASADGKTTAVAPSSATVALAQTPSSDFVFNKWTVSGATVSGNTLTVGNTNATATANYNGLTADPTEVSTDVRVGYSTKNFTDVTVTNVSAAGLGALNLDTKVTAGDTFSSDAPTAGTVGAFLAPSISADPLASGANTTLSVKLNAGLATVGNGQTAYVWVYDKTTNTIRAKVKVTVNVKEASGATATPSEYTWDTYTESIGHDGTTKTQNIKIDLADIADITSITLNGTSLTKGTHYTVGAVTGSGDSASQTVTLTTDGLKKIASDIVGTGATQGTLTVTAKDKDGASKTANVTAKIIDTMPQIAGVTFKKSSYTVGDTVEIDKIFVQNYGEASKTEKTPTDLTGKVDFEWYVGGTKQAGAAGASLDTSSLSAGNLVEVKVIGKGVAYTAKPSTEDNYKGTASTSTTLAKKTYSVSTAVALATSEGATSDLTHSTSASSVEDGGYVTLTTSAGTGYEFVEWKVTTGSGTFASDTANGNKTTTFWPAETGTVVTAKWKAVPVLGLAKKSTTTTGSAWSGTLSNTGKAEATNLTSTLTGTGSEHFTVTIAPSLTDKKVGAGGSVDVEITADNTKLTPGTTYVLDLTVTGTAGEENYTSNTVQVIYKYEPTYTVTIVAGSNMTQVAAQLDGKGTTTTATQSANNKTITIPYNHYVALTGTAASGYKFDSWTVNPEANATLTSASANANFATYVPSGDATITGAAKAVTNLSLTDTKTSASATNGYTTATDAYTGKLKNTGAAAGTVKYTLQNITKPSGAPDAPFTIQVGGNAVTSGNTAGITASNTAGMDVKVIAAASLPVGTYGADLVVEETTAVGDTMNGQYTKTVHVTFVVTEKTTFTGKVKVLVDGDVNKVPTGTAVKLGAVEQATATSGVYSFDGLNRNTRYEIMVKLGSSGSYASTGLYVSYTADEETFEVNYYTLALSAKTGGTDQPASATLQINGVTQSSAIIQSGKTATIQATAAGAGAGDFAFKAWTANPDSVAAPSGNPATVQVNGTVTYTAEFEKTVKWQLKYDANLSNAPGGGVKSGTSVIVPNDASYSPSEASDGVAVSSYVPTLPGYVFRGWNSLADGTGDWYKAVDSTITNSKDKVTLSATPTTLYAIWTRAAITIDANSLQGGTYGSSYSNSITASSSDGGQVSIALNTSDATAKLGGLTLADDGSGLVTGMPYLVGDGVIQIPVVVTLKNDQGATPLEQTGTLTVSVGKAMPRITEVTATGVVAGADVDKASYTVKVVGPLYKDGATTPSWDLNHVETLTYANGSKTAGVGSVTFAEKGDGADNKFNAGTTTVTASFAVDNGTAMDSCTKNQGAIWLNPAAFDTAVQDDGSTYQVALDEEGTQFIDSHVYVGANSEQARQGNYAVSGSGTDGLVILDDSSNSNKDTVNAWQVTIYNKGNQATGSLSYTWAKKAGNFDLDAASKATLTTGIAAGGSINIKLLVNKTNLSKGSYTDTLTITNTALSNSVTLNVTFLVDGPKTFDSAITVASTGYGVAVSDKLPSGVVLTLKDTSNTTVATSDGSSATITYDSNSKTYKVAADTLVVGQVYDLVVTGLGSNSAYTVGSISNDKKNATVTLYEVKAEADPSDLTLGSQGGEGWYISGQQAVLTTPTTGTKNSKAHNFEKWYVTGDTNKATVSNIATHAVTVDGAKSFTALYEATEDPTITLSYDANANGEAVYPPTSDSQKLTGSTVEFTVKDGPTRDHWIFAGWKNTTNTSDTTVYQKDSKININTNTTLTAQWTKAGVTGGSNWAYETPEDGVYGSTFRLEIADNKAPGTDDGAGVVYSATGLPGGLTIDPNTGVISGRPYAITDGTEVTITATHKYWNGSTEERPAQTATTKVTIKVVPATPTLTVVSATGAVNGQAHTTGSYVAVAQMPILTTKGTDGKPDVWNDLYMDPVSVNPDTATSVGALSVTTGTQNFGTNNKVGLKYTPSTTAEDAAGNKHNVIYNEATATKDVSAGDSYALTVAAGSAASTTATTASNDFGKLTLNTAGTAQSFILKNTGTGATGALTYQWTNGTGTSDYFDIDLPTTGAVNWTNGLSSDATGSFTITPKALSSVGKYNDILTITGAKGGSVTVSVSFEVVDPETFTATVTTLGQSVADFAASTPVAASKQAISGVSVKVTELDVKQGETADTKTATTTDGAYTFTLKTGSRYSVSILGTGGGEYLVPNLVISYNEKDKSVTLYEVTTAATDSMTAPSGAGYYVAGQPITVTATAGDTAKAYQGMKDTTKATVDNVTAFLTKDQVYKFVAQEPKALTAVYGSQVKLTYDLNGGTAPDSGARPSTDATAYPVRQQVTLSDTNFTKAGSVFAGWSTDQNATTATYQAGQAFTITADTTLYAVWQSAAELSLSGQTFTLAHKEQMTATTVSAAGGTGPYTYAMSDADQAKLTAIGISWTDNTGTSNNFTFSGTAKYTDGNDVTVTVTATDSIGGSTNAEYTFKVSKAVTAVDRGFTGLKTGESVYVGNTPSDLIDSLAPATDGPTVEAKEADGTTKNNNVTFNALVDATEPGIPDDNEYGTWSVVGPDKLVAGDNVITLKYTPKDTGFLPCETKVTITITKKIINEVDVGITFPGQDSKWKVEKASVERVAGTPTTVAESDVQVNGITWISGTDSYDPTQTVGVFVTLEALDGWEFATGNDGKPTVTGLFKDGTFANEVFTAGSDTKNVTVQGTKDIIVLSATWDPSESIIPNVFVSAGSPVGGTTANTVTPTDDDGRWNHYSLSDITWREHSDNDTGAVVGTGEGQVAFVTGNSYDLFITVTDTKGFTLSEPNFKENKAAGTSLGEHAELTIGSTKVTGTVKTEYSTTDGRSTITIKFANVQAIAKAVSLITASGSDAKYSQTGASDKHHDGNAVGSNSKIKTNPFTFDKSQLTVTEIYSDGTLAGTNLASGNFKVYVDSDNNGQIDPNTDTCLDGHSFDNYNTDKDDVTAFDGKTLWVVYAPNGTVDGSVAPVKAGTLEVKKLKADAIQPDKNTVKRTYKAGDTFAVPTGENVMKATVTFNDNTSLKNSVAEIPHGSNQSATYFFAVKTGDNTYVTLTDSTTMDAAWNGKELYIGYTDVNDNTVYAPLGVLSVAGESKAEVGITKGGQPVVEPGNPAEYGDTLVADVKPADGEPITGNLTYQWYVNEPDESDPNTPVWKPITGATGSTYVPGAEVVNKEIKVVVKEEGKPGSIESQPATVYPRTLTLDVVRVNKVYDGTATNTYNYTANDFILGNVLNADKGSVTVTYTGTKPNYQKNNADSAEVGAKITWPAIVLTGEGATRNNYTLTCPKSGTGDDAVDVYRLAAQNAIPERGEITGSTINTIIVKNDDVVPTKNGNPTETEFKKPSGENRYDVEDGTDVPNEGKWQKKDGDKWVDVDVDSTTGKPTFLPGNTYKVTVEVGPTDGNNFGSSPTGYIDVKGELLPAVVTVNNGVATLTKEFEIPADGSVAVQLVTAHLKGQPVSGMPIPTAPETVARNDQNTAPDGTKNYTATWYTNYDASTHSGTPVSGNNFQAGQTYTVEIKVKAASGYTYDNNTQFLITTGTTGVDSYKAGAYHDEADAVGVYTMWYTFPVTENGVTGVNVSAAVKDVYYVQTDTHKTVNTADDNDTIPGGKKDVGFTFTAANVTVTTADNNTETLKADNYGKTWGLYYEGTNNALTLLANNTTFTDETMDGKDLYLYRIQEAVEGSATQYNRSDRIYSSPAATLVVRELEAMEISGSTNSRTSTYKSGDKLTAPSWSSGSPVVKFNTDVTALNVTFAAGTGALTENKTTTATNATKEFYYELGTERVDLSGGDNNYVVKSTDANKHLYACYTDINGHEVRMDLGALTVNGQVGGVSIAYRTPTTATQPEDYVSYTDKTVASIPGKDAETNGTKWYATTDASTFDKKGNALLFKGDAGAANFSADGYYMVENVIEAQTGYVFSAATEVVVDGWKVAANSIAVPVKDDGNTVADGLVNVKATLSDGKITVQSIYHVPATVPGKINAVSVTYPEPATDGTPSTVPTYEDKNLVSIDSSTGTAWYATTKPGNSDASGSDSFTKGTPQGTNAFKDTTYYRVEATITPKGNNEFVENMLVTINGVQVTVGGAMGVKYDAKGEAIGWAVAVTGDDNIVAKYIARTAPVDKVIKEVTTNAKAPAENGDPTTEAYKESAEVTMAVSESDSVVTSHVTVGDVTWEQKSGETWGTVTGNKFAKGGVYKATYIVTTTPDDEYAFKDHDTENAQRVKFNIHGFEITGAGTVDDSANTGYVITTRKDSKTQYTITVQYPAVESDTPITEVTVNYTAPVDKAAPAVSNNYTSTEQVELDRDSVKTDNTNGSTWHSGDKNGAALDPANGDKFNNGDHTVASTFSAKEGFVFSNNTKFIVNGVAYTKAGNTDNVTISSDNKTATVWHTFKGLDKEIVKVVTSVAAPAADVLLPTSANTTVAANAGNTNLLDAALVSGGDVAITWTDKGGNIVTGNKADYDTAYTATIVLEVSEGYSYRKDNQYVDFILNAYSALAVTNESTQVKSEDERVTLTKMSDTQYKLEITFPATAEKPVETKNIGAVYIQYNAPAKDGVPTADAYKEPVTYTNTAEVTIAEGGTAWNEGKLTGTTAAVTTFGADKYYVVTATVTANEGYAFTAGTDFTVNDTTTKPGNAIAEKMSVTLSDENKTATVKYVFHVPAEDKTIVRVVSNATQPVAGETIPTTAASLLLAQNASGENMKDGVAVGNMTWTLANGSAIPAGDNDKFVAGNSYKVTFDVSAADGYGFLAEDTNDDSTADDFVKFLINGVHNNGNWLNGAGNATEQNIKVTTTQKDGTNAYTVTVEFPKTGSTADVLTVWGQVTEPEANGDIKTDSITVPDTEPYEKTSAKWEHWNGTAWEAASGTFQPGEKYKATLTVGMKTEQNSKYRFTDSTAGYVNSDNAKDGNSDPSITRTETDDAVTGITLTKEYTVPKQAVTVHVGSTVPSAGASVSDVNGSIGIHSNYTDDSSYYTLANGKWYNAEGTAPATSFEAGETYKLIVEATPKDGYKLSDESNGYLWVNNSKTASDKPVVLNADNGSYKVVFEYRIPNATVSGDALVTVPVPAKGGTPGTGTSPNNSIALDAENTTWKDSSGNSVSRFEDNKTYIATVVIDTSKEGNQGYKDGDTVYVNGVKQEIKTDSDGKLYVTYQYTIPKEQTINPGNNSSSTTVTVETPVVTYWLGETGITEDLTAEKVTRNKMPTKVPTVTGLDGYKFLGWSETDPAKTTGKPVLVNPTTFKILKDKTFYAVYEVEGHTAIDHSHYVIGYPDGTFRPNDNIDRASVATIIARACLDGFVEGSDYGNPGQYTDVNGHWAASAIAYCTMNGVFTGYEDGTFQPNKPITRQEFTLVVARLAGMKTSQGLPFKDSAEVSPWAADGVYTAYASGWVNGYEDGTFRPHNNITRAESVKIFNGFLGRGVDAEGLSGMREYVHSGVASNNNQNGHDEYMTWPDVTKSHWAYYEIIEAANDHTFYWLDESNPVPPEHWQSVWIDEVWNYHDDANG